MRTGEKEKHTHIVNVRSNAKIILQLSKTLEKKTSRVLVFQPGALQKKK